MHFPLIFLAYCIASAAFDLFFWFLTHPIILGCVARPHPSCDPYLFSQGATARAKAHFQSAIQVFPFLCGATAHFSIMRSIILLTPLFSSLGLVDFLHFCTHFKLIPTFIGMDFGFGKDAPPGVDRRGVERHQWLKKPTPPRCQPEGCGAVILA